MYADVNPKVTKEEMHRLKKVLKTDDVDVFLDKDAEVEKYLKINESGHSFAIIFYVRKDGLRKVMYII